MLLKHTACALRFCVRSQIDGLRDAFVNMFWPWCLLLRLLSGGFSPHLATMIMEGDAVVTGTAEEEAAAVQRQLWRRWLRERLQ